ncbi:MAG: methyltransferase domain-containing protein [bacterium]
MNQLNLGCGQFPKKDFINVDIDKSSKADLICNLDKFPYPFKDQRFDLVTAEHLIEHLEDPFKVMAELNRILKYGGKLVIKAPHFSRGFTHAGHKRGIDVGFSYYFRPEFSGGYSGTKYLLLKVRFRWLAQEELKKSVLSPAVFFISRLLGKCIDFFANISPLFCSRFWCFWVGGFDEIEFHFQKPHRIS